MNAVSRRYVNKVFSGKMNGQATEGLLPKKSKDVYDKEYDKFQCWLADNGVESINEAVLLRYFGELSESFSPNSLWTKYSMLKKTLFVNKKIDIGQYHKLAEFLKHKSKSYEAKKSEVLTREEVLKFIHEAPNKTFLMVKVALLFGVFGGCRRQELVNMLVDHIEDRGSVVVVTIPDKKRVFTIIEEKELGSLNLIREYAALRPQDCSERRFFLNYKNGRCTVQPVGKNTFGKIPSTIATYLGLKDADKYTGHCLRKTSTTLFADAGVSMTTLKRHGGYIEDSISSKITNYCFQELSFSMDGDGNSRIENFASPSFSSVPATYPEVTPSTTTILFRKPEVQDPLRLESADDVAQGEEEIKIEVEQMIGAEETEDSSHKIEDVDAITTEVMYLRNEVKKLNTTIAELREELIESKRRETKLEHIVKSVRQLVNEESLTFVANIKQEKIDL